MKINGFLLNLKRKSNCFIANTLIFHTLVAELYIFMRTLTTTIMALVLCFSGFCQDWTALESNETFSIYFAKVEHDSPSDGIRHERIVFRYENQTNQELVLRFNRELIYAPNAETIVQEQDFEVVIPANTSLSYDASQSYDKTYYVFSKDLKGTIKRSLMDFKLTNLQVN